MSVTPIVRLPFTDLTAGIGSSQFYGPCREMEMRMVECMEAYGRERGGKKCKLLIDDFYECALRTKQRKRIEAMQAERLRQYKAGERSKEELYAPAPKIDSY